jgi:biotin carboxyl carrier protein
MAPPGGGEGGGGGAPGGTGRRDRAAVPGGTVSMVRDGRRLRLVLEAAEAAVGSVEADEALIAAPMPGKVMRLLVAEGDRVARGETLAILEAMKMEHRLAAPHDGRVSALHVVEGEQIEEGKILLDLDREE